LQLPTHSPRFPHREGSPGVGIRLSPHFYNTRDEIDAVVAEIARIVERRDYTDVAHATPVT